VAAIVKNEETLRQNMLSLYVVVMSLCYPTMEDKVMTHESYPEIKRTRDTLKLLQVIKQLMYSNGSKELHTVHNQVMFRIQQESGQSPQSFQDHGNEASLLSTGATYRSDRAGSKGSTKMRWCDNPTGEQLKEAEKRPQKNFLPYCFYTWWIGTGMARS